MYDYRNRIRMPLNGVIKNPFIGTRCGGSHVQSWLFGKEEIQKTVLKS
jgi:hypothetical protein